MTQRIRMHVRMNQLVQDGPGDHYRDSGPRKRSRCWATTHRTSCLVCPGATYFRCSVVVFLMVTVLMLFEQWSFLSLSVWLISLGVRVSLSIRRLLSQTPCVRYESLRYRRHTLTPFEDDVTIEIRGDSLHCSAALGNFCHINKALYRLNQSSVFLPAWWQLPSWTFIGGV